MKNDSITCTARRAYRNAVPISAPAKDLASPTYPKSRPRCQSLDTEERDGRNRVTSRVLTRVKLNRTENLNFDVLQRTGIFRETALRRPAAPPPTFLPQAAYRGHSPDRIYPLASFPTCSRPHPPQGRTSSSGSRLLASLG